MPLILHTHDTLARLAALCGFVLLLAAELVVAERASADDLPFSVFLLAMLVDLPVIYAALWRPLLAPWAARGYARRALGVALTWDEAQLATELFSWDPIERRWYPCGELIGAEDATRRTRLLALAVETRARRGGSLAWRTQQASPLGRSMSAAAWWGSAAAGLSCFAALILLTSDRIQDADDGARKILVLLDLLAAALAWVGLAHAARGIERRLGRRARPDDDAGRKFRAGGLVDRTKWRR